MIKKWKSALIAVASLAAVAISAGQSAQAQSGEDPGPAAYAGALKGKRVVLVPMAMGFDLAQGWAAYLKREVEAWGGTFDTRDPNWDTAAGAQAITDLISSDPKPDVLVVHSPDLNSYSKLLKKAQKDGIYVVLVDNPMNYPADAFVGSDWDRLGQLEAEAVVKGCGENSSKMAAPEPVTAGICRIYRDTGQGVLRERQSMICKASRCCLLKFAPNRSEPRLLLAG